MYVTDFVCTYRRIDDEDASDELYRNQFLTAFDCQEGYDDSKINLGLNEVKQILLSHKEGKTFLEDAVQIGLPATLAIFSSFGEQSRDGNVDAVLRAFYGWQTMDLMHSFVSKIKNGEDVSRAQREALIGQYRTSHGF